MTPEQVEVEYNRITKEIQKLRIQRRQLPDVAEEWNVGDSCCIRKNLRSKDEMWAMVCGSEGRWFCDVAGASGPADTKEAAMARADKALQEGGVLLKGKVYA